MTAPAQLLLNLRADPALTRPARIAIGLAMHEDGFAARDVARVASLRWGLVIELRRALGELDPRYASSRPRGAPALLRHHREYREPRNLALAVSALADIPIESVPHVAARLHLNRLSAYGIRRAIDYARSVAKRPELTAEYRCPACEQRSLHHPCDHCGEEWLNS